MDTVMKKKAIVKKVYLCMVILVCFFCFSFAQAKPSKEEYPSVEVMVGQMLMVGFRGADVEKDAKLIAPTLDAIEQGKIGGVILFDKDVLLPNSTRNITSLTQLRKLTTLMQKRATIPLFIAIDQEGGLVQRLKESHGVPSTPSAEEMGKLDPRETKKFAKRLGRSLASCGINVNFAPSLDVNINRESPVIGALGRSFSSNPKIVELHGKAFAKGMFEHGIIPVYKHFPGHGSATGDSHLGFTEITKTWEKEELDPYRSVVTQCASAMIMVGHMVNKHLDNTYPASLSYATITHLLRKNIAWKGVIVSDDLNMASVRTLYSEKEAILLAIKAGEDILLVGNNLTYDPMVADTMHKMLLELVAEGKISKKRLYESYKRIFTLKQNILAEHKTL